MLYRDRQTIAIIKSNKFKIFVDNLSFSYTFRCGKFYFDIYRFKFYHKHILEKKQASSIDKIKNRLNLLCIVYTFFSLKFHILT